MHSRTPVRLQPREPGFIKVPVPPPLHVTAHPRPPPLAGLSPPSQLQPKSRGIEFLREGQLPQGGDPTAPNTFIPHSTWSAPKQGSRGRHPRDQGHCVWTDDGPVPLMASGGEHFLRAPLPLAQCPGPHWPRQEPFLAVTASPLPSGSIEPHKCAAPPSHQDSPKPAAWAETLARPDPIPAPALDPPDLGSPAQGH